MPNEHPVEEDLVMLYYRENPFSENGSEKGNADRLQAHLESCPSCRTAYDRLVRVLDACDDLPVPEPHAAFESRVWNRLEPQLHPLNQRFSLLSSLYAFLDRRYLAAAAVAAMLIVAFLAGRFTKQTPSQPARLVAITADGRQRVLLVALGDHLERSEMVLTELANAPDQPSELPVERERVRRLISENRLYRQTAGQSGDPAVAQLLDELERVLLDISHGADSREIKSRIDSESLLFKLRVLGNTLNQTDSATQPPTPSPTSKETL